MIWLTCLSILGYCLTVTRFSSRKIETTPFFVISTIILLLYFFAYGDYLSIATDIILMSGGILFLFSPFLLYTQRHVFFQKYATPAMLISLGFIVLFLLLAYHVRFSAWDEFTHWGPHSKLVFNHNGFLTAQDVVIHKSYPLGGALFQYFFFRLPGFSEGTAYAAQCLLLMAPLSILIQHFDWSSWKKAFIAFGLTLFFLLLLKVKIGPIDSLYMDSAVGVYFGMSIVAFLSSERKMAEVLFLIPMIATLMLFKQKLLPFVILIAVIIFSIQWMRCKKLTMTSVFAVCTLPITALLISQSWHHYLKQIDASVEWKLPLTLSKLKMAFLAPAGSTAHSIIIHYCHALLPVLFFLSLMVLLNVLAFYLYRKKASALLSQPNTCASGRLDRQMLIVVNILLFLGLTAYVFGLLLLYLFSFSAYEGLIHASMDRYLRIYFIGWTLVTLYFLYDAIRFYRWPAKIENGAIITIVAAMIYFIYAKNASYERYQNMMRLRNAVATIANAVKQKTSNNAKIFTVWQNSAGLERAILLYELTPRITNMGCTSFGKKYLPADVWTCSITPAQFKKRIAKYQYLLLAYTDKNFWKKYQSVLPDQNTIKPLVAYTLCQGTGFNTVGVAGCKMQVHHAYLLRKPS